MFGATPGDVADAMARFHLARNKSTFVTSSTDEQGLAVVSTFDCARWYHTTGCVAPACASYVNSACFHWCGWCRGGIYDYIFTFNKHADKLCKIMLTLFKECVKMIKENDDLIYHS